MRQIRLVSILVGAVLTSGRGAIADDSAFFHRPAIHGIACDTMEGAALHIHAVLQIRDGNKEIAVPARVGMPVAAQCVYWLHTHSANGVIHIESPQQRTFTLGDFFDVWGESLTSYRAADLRADGNTPLAVFVNGKQQKGVSLRSIVLRDGERILIERHPIRQ